MGQRTENWKSYREIVRLGLKEYHYDKYSDLEEQFSARKDTTYHNSIVKNYTVPRLGETVAYEIITIFDLDDRGMPVQIRIKNPVQKGEVRNIPQKFKVFGRVCSENTREIKDGDEIHLPAIYSPRYEKRKLDDYLDFDNMTVENFRQIYHETQNNKNGKNLVTRMEQLAEKYDMLPKRNYTPNDIWIVRVMLHKQYLTICIDCDLASYRIYDVIIGDDSDIEETIKKLADKIPYPEKVKNVCININAVMLNCVKKRFRNASVILDNTMLIRLIEDIEEVFFDSRDTTEFLQVGKYEDLNLREIITNAIRFFMNNNYQDNIISGKNRVEYLINVVNKVKSYYKKEPEIKKLTSQFEQNYYCFSDEERYKQFRRENNCFWAITPYRLQTMIGNLASRANYSRLTPERVRLRLLVQSAQIDTKFIEEEYWNTRKNDLLNSARGIYSSTFFRCRPMEGIENEELKYCSEEELIVLLIDYLKERRRLSEKNWHREDHFVFAGDTFIGTIEENTPMCCSCCFNEEFCNGMTVSEGAECCMDVDCFEFGERSPCDRFQKDSEKNSPLNKLIMSFNTRKMRNRKK